MAIRDRPLRVAIVGTGLAGLSTAYLLAECKASDATGRPLKVEVHLLDRSDSIGMDTASLSIKSDSDETFRVDVPMRSINGGSHGRVRKLYQHLGVPLVRSDFSYSFSRLADPSSSSPLRPPPPPPSRPDADASDPEEEDADEAPMPPPAYSEATESSRPPSPGADSDSASDPKLAIPARPCQTTFLLYQGASGLRWPPLSLPSHFHSASTSLGEKVAYVAETACLALSYLYLLALAFFYVSLGLSRPPSTTTRRHQSRTSSSFERFGIADVAAVPLQEFCEKHRVPRQMVDKVLIPLMAAVATIGVDQARRMPTGEVLDYIVDTFAHSHYVTDPSVGVRGIVRRLVAPIPPAQIHLGIEITRIEALVAQPDAAYRIHYRCQKSGTSEQVGLRSLEVDHVVFATQADQAARLLSSLGHSSSTTTTAGAAAPATEENADSLKKEAIKALQAFTYVRTLVVTHRDHSVLPADGKDRRDLNLAVFEEPESFSTGGSSSSVVEQQHWDESLDYLPPSSVQTTHIISPIRRRAHHPHSTAASKANAPPAPTAAVLQTTNPIVPIDAKHILSSTWFSRAFATAESQAILGRFLLPSSTPSPSPSTSSSSTPSSSSSTLQGRALGYPTTSSSTTTTGGIWFVGSYVATGFPLLEGCVSSAENVVRALVRQERATFDGPWLF